MKPENINEKALDFLSRQEWEKAQKLFFHNAKSNPCHETINNLGYYLVTEGLLCRNGKTINALTRGLKYLIEASVYKTTTINTSAIIKAISYKLRTAKDYEKVSMYKYACNLLENTQLLKSTNEMNYNLLCFRYLIDSKNKELLPAVRNLVKEFVCSESISLYLEVLSTNSLLNEGLRCIEKYGAYLNEVEMLMFYTKFEVFEKGYDLCRTVSREYDIDEFTASAITECCFQTRHLLELNEYKRRIQNAPDIKRSSKKEMWRYKILEDSASAASCRKSIINNYRLQPTLIDSCCYFGCSTHNTEWNSD